MDRSAYEQHLEIDRVHFWRVAKRRLLEDLMATVAPRGSDLRLLDIGGASSLYPATLAQWGRVTVIEPDAQSVGSTPNE